MWNKGCGTPNGADIPGLTREIQLYFINFIFTDLGMKAQNKVLCTKSQVEELNCTQAVCLQRPHSSSFHSISQALGKYMNPGLRHQGLVRTASKPGPLMPYLKFSGSTFKRKHCKEIQLVHSEEDQPWDFFERNDAKAETPILWPPHAKSWLIGKDSDAGRD